MNQEERFYCSICQVPVEYAPEIDIYTCGQCEGMFTRDEVITQSDLEIQVDYAVLDEPYDRGGIKNE